MKESKYIDIVFGKMPGPDGSTFVEVEDMNGFSIRYGEWVERDDGYSALRIPDYRGDKDDQ